MCLAQGHNTVPRDYKTTHYGYIIDNDCNMIYEIHGVQHFLSVHHLSENVFFKISLF